MTSPGPGLISLCFVSLLLSFSGDPCLGQGDAGTWVGATSLGQNFPLMPLYSSKMGFLQASIDHRSQPPKWIYFLPSVPDGHSGSRLPPSATRCLVDRAGLDRCTLVCPSSQVVLTITHLPVHSDSFWPQDCPRFFTKLMKIVATEYTDQAIDALFYLDDWLLLAPS